MKIKDAIPGATVGRLTIVRVEPSDKRNGKRAMAFTLCACGTEKAVPVYTLGRCTHSCGCMYRESRGKTNASHGHAHKGHRTREYLSWDSMVSRCTRDNSKHYKNYGGRGIRVCESWLVFENFLADMGPRPPGMTLDRFPNTNGHYEPGNCRWATRAQQARNTTRTIMVEIGGRAQCLADWADGAGIRRSTLYERYAAGVRGAALLGTEGL